MGTRYYKIMDKETKKVVQLVEAVSRQGALYAVAASQLEADVASAKDMAEAIKNKTPVLALEPAADATAETQPSEVVTVKDGLGGGQVVVMEGKPPAV